MIDFLQMAYRRRSWVAGGLTFRKVQNLAKVATAFLTKAETMNALPPMLKIDISPLCTLRCPHCVHADPAGRSLPLLDAQEFGKHDRMSTDSFARIIDQVKNRTIAVSLFYYGDPYAHPQVDELCGIARAGDLTVHLTTHFSYTFSDSRIEKIARSGVTHLTVAVDGATQQTYEVTRVGGRLDLVLSNLRRLAQYRRDHGLRWPFIEVQHLQHAHHPPGEVARVRAIVSDYGVDQFTTYQGSYLRSSGDLANVVGGDIDQSEVGDPLSSKAVPRCEWPYFSMLIRFNGDVIPCCFHRVARQHSLLHGRATIGNVFEQPVTEIWNNERYRANRRLVSNPSEAGSVSLKESFCYGCRTIYNVAPKEPAGLVERVTSAGPSIVHAIREAHRPSKVGDGL